MPDGEVNDDFKNAYDFKPVAYAHGNGAMSGSFHGQIQTLSSGQRILTGQASLSFDDVFTDPLRIIDRGLPALGIRNAGELVMLLAEVGGAKYSLHGTWTIDVAETL